MQACTKSCVLLIPVDCTAPLVYHSNSCIISIARDAVNCAKVAHCAVATVHATLHLHSEASSSSNFSKLRTCTRCERCCACAVLTGSVLLAMLTADCVFVGTMSAGCGPG